MNFFKSVFSVDSDDDPQRQQQGEQQTMLNDNHDDDDGQQQQEVRLDDDDGQQQQEVRLDDDDDDDLPQEHPKSDDDDRPSSPVAGVWGFGGLIKTLASRSESVMLTYRRDLLEFGSGLKKETAAIREVAARVVMDLPASLESGASAAQESLESVGQVIDDLGDSVWRGTAEIISQGKDVLLSIDADAAGSSSDAGSAPHQTAGSSAANRGYSRFEAQLMAVQADQSTFLEDPDDVDDFNLWREGFVVAEKDDEIDEFCTDNVVLEGMFQKLVPRAVDYDTFWTRYYYKVFKLKQAEDARAKLVKRVISTEEEENLSWEVDDDDYDDSSEKTGFEKEGEQNKTQVDAEVVQGDAKHEETKVALQAETEITGAVSKGVEKSVEETEVVKNVVEECHLVSPAKEGEPEEKLVVPSKSNVDVVGKSDDDKTEGKLEPSESCKDSDISIVSTQPSGQEEDDLGWDEIEDLGENDDNKPAVASSSIPNKVDLRKRLSAGEDDEDLSWDIEDD